jgi:NAD-dependent SIR2 family protein deacetylase
MPSYISLDMGCSDCGWHWDGLVERAEAAQELLPPCPACGLEGKSYRRLQAPALMQRSFPDGRKRSDIQKQVESLKLESQSYEMPAEKRGPINQEIQKLREVKK